MDETVTQWINAAAGRNAIVDAIFIGITTAGVPLIVLGVAAQWWSIRNREHLRHVSIAAAFSSLGALAVNWLILLFVHRARPYVSGLTHLIVAPSADWSFPSDHAAVAFGIAATFAVSDERRRAVAFVVLALLISWSRVFVGTHFLSDVLGGALIGAGAAVAVSGLYSEGTPFDRWLTNIF